MKIACVQTDVSFKDINANLSSLEATVRNEVNQGTELTVFPECYSTGYCFDSLAEAMEFSESVPGPSTDRVAKLCAELKTHVVFGMLEKSGDDLFNVAVLIGPDGLIGCYRKVHLPYLGVDRFTTPGDRPFEVFEAAGVRIGMLICYDGGFPEAARVLSIRGADLIVLPTNWPPGGSYMAEFSINCRAMENGIYFAAVNRIGTENGFSFIGKSRICSPVGATINSIDDASTGILRTEIDPMVARTKRIVRVPGKHLIDRMADRRPEMYAAICEPHSLKRPGRDEPV
ncbi:MAG: carbon-nitrogen hydrolase family protein [Planctomycetota bacterium]|nr:MAG: carbon-nitrogen hydrolase family protein [Planctomycetota bacterium]